MQCDLDIKDLQTKWQNNCPLLPIIEHCKKHKKCCKEYKKGDRCKKCPGRK